MRKIVAVVVGVVVLLGLGATSASATSNVVHHTETNWGRIVDGPSGKNTLVYACDGQNDGNPVATEVNTRSRLTGAVGWLRVWDYTPNDGCESKSTTQEFDGYTYAYELRVCESRPNNWYYCTNWYETNW